MFHPFPLRGEAAGPVQPVYGAVEGGVGVAEVGGHQGGVVQVGQGCVGMGGAGVEDGLGQGCQF